MVKPKEKVNVEPKKSKGQKEKIPATITGKITRLKVKETKRYIQHDGKWKCLCTLCLLTACVGRVCSSHDQIII